MTTPFPANAEKTYDVLSNQLVWFGHGWRTYKFLFGHTQRRIDFLNEAAASCFFTIQDAMYDDVVLNVCTLLDPPGSGSRKNLTFQSLMLEIKAGDSDLGDVLKQMFENEIEPAAQTLRDYRNKGVAHLDHAVATKQATLDGPSREQVNAVFELMTKFLNIVAAKYKDTTVFYDHLNADGGPDQLLNLMKAGFRYFALLDQEVIPYDDDPNGDWADA
jgi:hypothetical protein